MRSAGCSIASRATYSAGRTTDAVSRHARGVQASFGSPSDRLVREPCEEVAPPLRVVLDCSSRWRHVHNPFNCYYMRMNADSSNNSNSEDASVGLAVEVFSMLADATRVRIILALRSQELSVSTLADIVSKSPASVSQHLAKLRLARIVLSRQDGTKIFYRLANEHASQLVTEAIFQAEHSLSADPAHHRAAHPASAGIN